MGQRFSIPIDGAGESAQDDILQILLHKPGDAPRSVSRVYIVGEIASVLHILHFTDLSNIQPVYYDKTYHAIPEQGGEKAYELLRKAMKEENKIAIAKTVLGTKEKLLALIPTDDDIMIETMYFADEVKEAPQAIRWARLAAFLGLSGRNGKLYRIWAP